MRLKRISKMSKRKMTLKRGDVIFLKPGSESANWLITLGPLLVIGDFIHDGETLGLPEVRMLDGGNPSREADWSYNNGKYLPYVDEGDVSRVDQFMTAAYRANHAKTKKEAPV